MKKHLSVLELMARSTIYRVFVLLISMVAVEAGLFWFQLSQGPNENGFSLEMVIRQSHISWVFGVFLLLLTMLLCQTGLETNSKQGYTMMRLSISERWVFFWQSVYNSICYLILWMVQVLIAMILSFLYVSKAPAEYVTNQTMFLAFYRNDFFHALLPFEDGMIWVVNIMVFVTLAICVARFPMVQWRGKRAFEFIPLACGIAILFSREIGDSIRCFHMVVLVFLCIVFPIYCMLGKEQSHED